MPPESPADLTKALDPAEINFTPGERSDVAWITTDVVDIDGDVIVGKGIDYASVFMKNPVVMVCHNYKTWPIGKCAWIKPAKTAGFAGLIAKTMWDDDPDAVRLWGLNQRGLIRGRSIGVKPPLDLRPGEWGPATAEELKARPDWARARMIVRRCVLYEYSVCPIPVNQESLTVAVNKAVNLGLELPDFLKELADAGVEKGAAGRAPETPPAATLPAFRTLDQVVAGLAARLAKSFDPAKLAGEAAKAAIDRARGAI